MSDGVASLTAMRVPVVEFRESFSWKVGHAERIHGQAPPRVGSGLGGRELERRASRLARSGGAQANPSVLGSRRTGLAARVLNAVALNRWRQSDVPACPAGLPGLNGPGQSRLAAHACPGGLAAPPHSAQSASYCCMSAPLKWRETHLHCERTRHVAWHNRPTDSVPSLIPQAQRLYEHAVARHAVAQPAPHARLLSQASRQEGAAAGKGERINKAARRDAAHRLQRLAAAALGVDHAPEPHHAVARAAGLHVRGVCRGGCLEGGGPRPRGQRPAGRGRLTAERAWRVACAQTKGCSTGCCPQATCLDEKKSREGGARTGGRPSDGETRAGRGGLLAQGGTHHKVAAAAHGHAADPRRRVAANAAGSLGPLAIRSRVCVRPPAPERARGMAGRGRGSAVAGAAEPAGLGSRAGRNSRAGGGQPGCGAGCGTAHCEHHPSHRIVNTASHTASLKGEKEFFAVLPLKQSTLPRTASRTPTPLPPPPPLPCIVNTPLAPHREHRLLLGRAPQGDAAVGAAGQPLAAGDVAAALDCRAVAPAGAGERWGERGWGWGWGGRGRVGGRWKNPRSSEGWAAEAPAPVHPK